MEFLAAEAINVGIGQGAGKVLPVHVAERDLSLAAIGTAHDVVNGAQILDVQFAGHAWALLQNSTRVQTVVWETMV